MRNTLYTAGSRVASALSLSSEAADHINLSGNQEGVCGRMDIPIIARLLRSSCLSCNLLNQNSHSSFVKGPPKLFPGSLNILRSVTSSLAVLGKVFALVGVAGDPAAVEIALAEVANAMGFRTGCTVSPPTFPETDGLSAPADAVFAVCAGPVVEPVATGARPVGLAGVDFGPADAGAGDGAAVDG